MIAVVRVNLGAQRATGDRPGYFRLMSFLRLRLLEISGDENFDVVGAKLSSLIEKAVSKEG